MLIKDDVKTPLLSPRSRFWSYGSLAALGLAASFALALALAQRDILRRHIAHESADTAWVVFLKGHGDRAALEEAIRAFPGIRSIRFISKEEALQIVEKDAVLSQGLTLTGRNPFPESFDVRWDPFFLRADFLGQAAKKLEALDGVDHVGYDRGRVERADLMQRFLRQLELALLGLAWAGAFLLLLLAGRLLFFPRGPFPGRLLLGGAAGGFLGGAAGAALAGRLLAGFPARALWCGAAVGLLGVLILSSFQEG